MPARKRTAAPEEGDNASLAKRRSSRRLASASVASDAEPVKSEASPEPAKPAKKPTKSKSTAAAAVKGKPAAETPKGKASAAKNSEDQSSRGRASSPNPDPDSIPRENPETVKHEGQWYWLMKAEPESRFENGHDVRFSIDDLRACTKPEGWDGIRNYSARNNLRAMNVGDMAFFYHSNCKTPGIVGTMEIVREQSEDKSARQPGTPYYDPASTKENPRWSLVHVEFRRKFAVPIYLPELKELGKPGGPLEQMQMIRQSRLSVSRVSAEEWQTLCALADQKAKDANLKHEE